MVGPNRWKRALSEPNAIGWIAFLILVFGIGVGALVFDHGSIRDPVQASYSQSR